MHVLVDTARCGSRLPTDPVSPLEDPSPQVCLLSAQRPCQGSVPPGGDAGQPYGAAGGGEVGMTAPPCKNQGWVPPAEAATVFYHLGPSCWWEDPRFQGLGTGTHS